jgi:anti-anti-sigma regulatory factor
MSEPENPRSPRRSASSQTFKAVTAPVPPPRGTQQTKLRADGKSVITVFKGKLDDKLVETAGTTAAGSLQGSDLVWILDFLQVPNFEGSPHAAFGKQLESFRNAGGRRIIVAIPESMTNFRILRSGLAALCLRSPRIDIYHASNSDELNKLIAEQLKR